MSETMKSESPEQRGAAPAPTTTVKMTAAADEQCRFVLQWDAAPRPPVHPNVMRGTQSFGSASDAIVFFRNLAADAHFVSMTEIRTMWIDRTADARSALAATEEQGDA